MTCHECRENDHVACTTQDCDCDTCWAATVESPCWYWFWQAVGQYLDAAYRQPTSHDDLDELRDEAEWLRRVERGDYGD